jgi:hypothetical protein
VNPQIAVSASLEDGLTARLLALLTDNLFTIAGIMVVGMGVGIASVSFVNKFRGDVDDAPADVRKRRNRQSQALGHLFGFLWTCGAVYGYLSGGFAAKALMAIGLGIIAGGGTPYLRDLLVWFWRTLVPAVGEWIVDKFRRMFKKDDR